MKQRRRRLSALTRYDHVLIVVIALASALAAGWSSASPSGLSAADALFRAGTAGLVTITASRARRWTNLVLAGTTFAVAHQWQLLPAGGALLMSFVMATRRVRLRLVGAVVGALSIQVLLRQLSYGFHGASTLVGAICMLPVLISAHNRSRSVARRRTRQVVAVLGAAAALATAAFGVALLLARHDLEDGAARAQEALASVRAGDAARAERELGQADVALRRSEARTGSWWAAPARVVPLIGHQAKAVALITGQGRRVVRSARVTAAVGDYRRLKYRTGRFDVAKLRGLQRPMADSAATLDRANHSFRALDRTWLVGPLRRRVDDIGRELARATPEADLASSVIERAPALLGANGTRHYFVAFITPSELRGAGGFIGNYGELTARNGRLRLTRSGPIAELINAAPRGRRRLWGPKDYLRRYGPFAPADHFQDVTFSPHFPFDADVIEQLYPQSGGRRVDGVISIDPIALAALLQFTGPITVPGLDTPLTSGNAADILLRQQYLTFGDSRTRKDLLVEASRITFDKLTNGSLPAPRTLSQVLGPMVSQRRIMLHGTRGAEQHLFTRLHADGALPVADGRDVLSIATDNAGNNKIDAFLRRDVTYDATVDPATGRVATTATIALHNDAPPSGLPPIVIGNSGNVAAGTNVMSLSLYSPLRLVDATLDGRRYGLQSDREAGLQVYSVRLSIPARTTQILRVNLAGGLDLRSGYRLVTSPQSVARADRVTVSVRATPGWRVIPGPGLRTRLHRATSGRQERKTATSYRVDFLRR